MWCWCFLEQPKVVVDEWFGAPEFNSPVWVSATLPSTLKKELQCIKMWKRRLCLGSGRRARPPAQQTWTTAEPKRARRGRCPPKEPMWRCFYISGLIGRHFLLVSKGNWETTKPEQKQFVFTKAWKFQMPNQDVTRSDPSNSFVYTQSSFSMPSRCSSVL